MIMSGAKSNCPYVNDPIDFYDIFHWEGGQWHAYLVARFLDAQDQYGTHEPYTAFDFVELSNSLSSTGILRVPEDYATIQAAIDAASPRGNTIYVQQGTYRENLDMRGKDIVLRSYFPDDAEGCVSNTVINGDIDDNGVGDGSVITFQGPETRMCVVSGFTITKGKSSMGGGVYGAGCQAQIVNNIITNNIAYSGGGIAFCSGEVQNNTINGNFAFAETGNEYSGLGGALFNCLTIYQNKIYGNTAAYAGAGIYSQYELFAVNNLIYNNELLSAPAETNAGAGIHIVDSERDWRWFIAHNTLVDNTGNTPYATNVYVPAAAKVVNCIIWGTYGGDGPDDKDLLAIIANNCNIQGCPDKSTVTTASWNFGCEPPNTPGFLGTGDNPYSLVLSSPNVNAGTNTNPPVNVDILNRPRVAAPDIGAYECTATVESDYVYITGPSQATEGDAVTLLANLNPDLDPVPQDVSYQWKFNGANVGTDSASLEMNPVQLSNQGTYTVTATYNGTPVVSNDFTLVILEQGEAEEGEEGVDGPAIQVDPFMLVLDNAPLGGSIDGVFSVKNVGNEVLDPLCQDD